MRGKEKKSMEKRITGKISFLVMLTYGGIIAAAVVRELADRRRKTE